LRDPLRRSLVTLCGVWLALVAPARAIVDTTNPVSGDAFPGSIPPLPVAPGTPGGFLFQPPLSTTGSLAVHEGSFSWQPNLGSPPTKVSHDACSILFPRSFGPLATPALFEHLDEATAAAGGTLDQLDSGGLGDAFDALETFNELLESFPGADPGPPPVVTVDSRTCLDYTPVYGRWLAGQWAKPPGSGFDVFYGYHPSPRPFREQRERGARLYCAARAAQFAQGDTPASMGSQVGFSVSILGENIDFLVSDAALALDGPKRFTGGGVNDGAQAFEVPLLLATRFQPISFLPGFREVRVPVSLVSADSEVQTPTTLRLLVKPGQAVLPGYSKTYQTVSHADRILSATRAATLDGVKTEIFRAGPVAVAFDYLVTYVVGELDSSDNRRVIRFPGFPTSRSGRVWQQPGTGRRLHDGAWTLLLPGFGFFPSGVPTPTYAVWPDGLQEAFWREPANFLTPPPLDIRLLQSDDHAIESRNSLTLGGSLIGILGGSFGPLEVALEVVGTLTGSVTQSFPLRDALLAQDQGEVRMTPITGLGVRARREAEATAKASAKLNLSLDLLFDEISWVETLFTVDPVTLAQYESDDALPPAGTAADDGASFRLGTGSRRGDVMKKPVVWSHLPNPSGGVELQSFDVGVDACLADPTPNPDTPLECDPLPAEGGPPAKELCAYGPTNDLEQPFGAPLPPQVCDNVPGYLAQLPPAIVECAGSLLEFLCSPVRKQQPLAGSFSEVVSHVLAVGTEELPNEAETTAFANAIETCAPSLGGAQAAAEKLFDYKICEADGTLFEDDEIFAAQNPTEAPPIQAASDCHP
jgi:hypothetical protein